VQKKYKRSHQGRITEAEKYNNDLAAQKLRKRATT